MVKAQRIGKSPDGNEGRAYVCVYEFEKVSKDKGKMGIAGGSDCAKKAVKNDVNLKFIKKK